MSLDLFGEIRELQRRLSNLERNEGSGAAAATGDTIVRKTADETVNNSSALQNDDELLFAVDASSTYVFEMSLLIDSATGAADFKCDFTVPAAAAAYWGPHFANVTGPVVYWDANPVSGANTLLITGAGVFSHGTPTNAGAITGLFLRGLVRVAATSGTVQFRWANNTATVGDLKVLTDSFIKYRKIT